MFNLPTRLKILSAMSGIVLSMLFPISFAMATSQSGPNELYIPSEQILALPSKNGNTALLVETIAVQNQSSHAQSISLPLPAGITEPEIIQSTNGHWLLRGSVLTTTSLAPGTTQVVVDMIVDLSQQAANLSFVSTLTVRNLYVIIPEGALVVSAQGGFEPSSQTLFVKGVAFRRFTRPELPAGQSFTLAITLLPTANLPEASPLPGVPVLNDNSEASANLEAIANLLLVAAILAVGVWAVRTSPGLGQYSERVSPLTSKSLLTQQLAKKQTVLQDWAALEDCYRKGGMEREEYEARRVIYRELAIDLELSMQSY